MRLRRVLGEIPTERWGTRPWHTEDCADEELGCCPCIVAQGKYGPDEEAPHVPVQYIADAETPGIARYIAVMGPGVAHRIVSLLEWEADMLEYTVRTNLDIGRNYLLEMAREIMRSAE